MIVETSQPKKKDEVKSAEVSEKPAEVVEKPKTRRGRKPKASADDPQPSSVSEAIVTVEKQTEIVVQAPEEIKPKRATKRTRARSVVSVDDEAKTSEEKEAPKAGRRVRKNSQAQIRPKSTISRDVIDLTDENPVETVPAIEIAEQPAEKKTTRRGRPKKVVEVSVEVPEPPPANKRTVRARTVSKSEDSTSKTVTIETIVEQKTDEPMKEPAKTRGKRTRKATAETEAEAQDPQPSSKRTRTKKTKDMEPEEQESSAKESATEKKTRKTKKAADSKDVEMVITSPISKRTRRHK